MPPKGLPSQRPPTMSSNYMVASGHQLAALAGMRILQSGGNAVDAGVASGIAINVTLPYLTSFAGVAPIIIYLAGSREVVTISGLGGWPGAAVLEDFRKKYNNVIPLGVGRSVVPSACDAWLTALERYGTMSFAEVVAPSLELAEKGFPVAHNMTRALRAFQEYIEMCPSTAEIFMQGGAPLRPGQLLVQKDLAGVFRQMMEEEETNSHQGRGEAIRAARDLFYKGEIAEKMVRFCQEQGGLLTMEDFAQFSVKVEKPEVGAYKDYTLYTCGPWCQGPTLIQILNILEGMDLQAMGHGSAQYIHTLVEAIKLAFADRHSYYGDPDFVDIPVAGLLSKEYAAQRREAIDPSRACPEMPAAGDPWRYQGKARTEGAVPAPIRSGTSGPDTSYTCVVDQWGNAFSATPSDGFNTSPIVPGLGMIISCRGHQSWLDSENPSCLGPRKRPRLTPNPAIAFKDGELFMPFGTPGGDTQVQAMVQMFLSIVDFGLDPQQAVELPRFISDSFPSSGWPHAYSPGQLTLEGDFPEDVIAGLANLGHRIVWWDDEIPTAGDPCGILVDRENGVLIGGADTRWDSCALGW